MDSKPTIILLTREFPFGRQGEEFLFDELENISSDYNIKIIATGIVENEKIKRNIPKHIESVCLYNRPIGTVNKILGCLKFVFRVELYDELRFLRKTNRLTTKNIKKLFAFGSASQRLYAEIKKRVDIDEGRMIFYSYWMTSSAYAAALFSSRHNIPSVSRTHSIDLYEERQNGYIPMRKYILDNVNGVFTISEQGQRYLTEKYGFADKTACFHLGVSNDKGKHPVKQLRPFRIVSCSSLISVKRVDVIAKAIGCIDDIPIEWIHFGDGEEREKILHLAETLPNNIKYEFKGHTENTLIKQYYDEKDVHVFINASTHEGIPVSIMEAMSFGIPAIATNVGGTSELVINNSNGILLPKDLTVEMLAKAIREIASMDAEDYRQLRENAYHKWEQDFNAYRNFNKFYQAISQIK